MLEGKCLAIRDHERGKTLKQVPKRAVRHPPWCRTQGFLSVNGFSIVLPIEGWGQLTKQNKLPSPSDSQRPHRFIPLLYSFHHSLNDVPFSLLQSCSLESGREIYLLRRKPKV